MLKRVIDKLRLDRLLPSCCALCTCTLDLNTANAESKQVGLCHFCLAHFFQNRTTRCSVCANPLENKQRSMVCGACLAQPPAYDMSLVATNYVAPYNSLIHGLKFQHRLVLAPVLARLLALTWQQSTYTQADYITAIPLSSQRLRERGFNQSLEIAKPLAKLLAIPLHPKLGVRSRHTQAQSSLAFNKRKNNLQGAFIIMDSVSVLKDKHIIVVDDVMTSGHTLNEFATCLKRYGVARVTNLIFARTIAH